MAHNREAYGENRNKLIKGEEELFTSYYNPTERLRTVSRLLIHWLDKNNPTNV